MCVLRSARGPCNVPVVRAAVTNETAAHEWATTLVASLLRHRCLSDIRHCRFQSVSVDCRNSVVISQAAGNSAVTVRRHRHRRNIQPAEVAGRCTSCRGSRTAIKVICHIRCRAYCKAHGNQVSGSRAGSSRCNLHGNSLRQSTTRRGNS
jgi:hypothetical protein